VTAVGGTSRSFVAFGDNHIRFIEIVIADFVALTVSAAAIITYSG
jgi:hypothetical protein